jgi:hypothetical protein
MLDWVGILALFLNINREREPDLIDQTQGSNSHLWSVLGVVVGLTDAFLNQLAEQISLRKFL